MNPYPSYKESGVDWIGEIPSEWDCIRGRFLFTKKKEINKEFQNDNLLSLTLNGVLNKDLESHEGLRPLDYKTYQIFEKDDLVFKLIDLENVKTSRVGLVHEKGIMSPVYIRLEPRPEILPRFSYYFYYDLYKKEIFNYLGLGVRSSLSPSDLLEIEIPLSTIQEQQQISTYLYHKTHQIDSLVEKTQQKIELLKEQKSSLINKVVTKGLNPDVEMKDSGVEWIGEIPSGWKVIQIRFISKMMRGKFSHRPRNDERFYDGDYPFIQTGDIVSSGKYLTNFTQTLNEMGYSVSKEFPIDTLVMSISGNIGDVSILKIKSCFPDSIIGFFPKNNNFIEYLFYLFLSMKDEFCKNSVVSTQLNLNVERVGSIRVPITSIQEQQQIVKHLDKETTKIDSTIEKETQRIELLKEYRQSLISNVVTGKVDVRDEVVV